MKLALGAVPLAIGLFLAGACGGTSTLEEPSEPKQEQAAKPEPKRSLYEQAVQAYPPPEYTVDYNSCCNNGQRQDAYVVTQAHEQPELGAILLVLQEDSGVDYVVAFFCAKPGEAACTETLFASGEYAATAQGKSFMTGEEVLSKVGEVPYMEITRGS